MHRSLTALPRALCPLQHVTGEVLEWAAGGDSSAPAVHAAHVATAAHAAGGSRPAAPAAGAGGSAVAMQAGAGGSEAAVCDGATMFERLLRRALQEPQGAEDLR